MARLTEVELDLPNQFKSLVESDGGINSTEKAEKFLKLLNSNEFPIHYQISKIDIKRSIWLPKLRACGFAEDKDNLILAMLFHMLFQKDNQGQKDNRPVLRLLVKLTYIPINLLPLMQDDLKSLINLGKSLLASVEAHSNVTNLYVEKFTLLLLANGDIKSKMEKIFQLLDFKDFPVVALIKIIDINQGVWLPKIERYEFDQGGICAALNHMWLHSDFKTFYTRLSKLSLGPQELLPHLMGHEISQFKILSDVLQNSEKFNKDVHQGSVGKLTHFLADKKNRDALGLDSQLNLIDFQQTEELYIKESSFYKKDDLVEKIGKFVAKTKLSLSTVIAHPTNGRGGIHRMGGKILIDPTDNGIFYSFYNSAAEHGEAGCNTAGELVGRINQSCIVLDPSLTFVPLRIRVYLDTHDFNNVNNNNVVDAQYEEKRKEVERLVKDGMINARLPSGHTPLFLAVRNGDDELVALLLQYGADPNITFSNFAKNPVLLCVLSEAAGHGYDNIVKLLLPKTANNIVQDDCHPLILAVLRNRLSTVRALLEAKRDELTAIIPLAIANAKDNKIKRELLGSKNSKQLTPLMEAIIQNDTKLMQALINFGADLTDVTPAGTALILAVQTGNFEMVQILVEKLSAQFISLDASDGFGRTALMYAASMDNAKIVNLLVEYNAYIFTKDNNDKMAIDYCSPNSACFALLDKQQKRNLLENISSQARKKQRLDEQESNINTEPSDFQSNGNINETTELSWINTSSFWGSVDTYQEKEFIYCSDIQSQNHIYIKASSSA